jgi:hypothetical protein
MDFMKIFAGIWDFKKGFISGFFPWGFGIWLCLKMGVCWYTPKNKRLFEWRK